MRHWSKKFLFMFLIALLGIQTTLAHQKGWRDKFLSQVFPEAVKFTSRKVTISSDQLSRIEQIIGERINSEDRNPTFYPSFNKDGKKIGYVLFTDQAGENGLIEMGVSVDTGGKVIHVIIFSSREDKQISEPGFLDQFHGKRIKDFFKPGVDITLVAGSQKGSEAVIWGVQKVLLIKQEVFGDQNP